MSLFRRALLYAALMLLPVPLLCAQENPTPSSAADDNSQPMTTLHVSSRIVLVDVSVTDARGHHITGLKASDFALSENGKSQHIRSFDEHTSSPETAIPARLKLPPLGPDIFTNYTPVPSSGTLTVVLLDMLNTPFREQSIVRDQLLKFLNGMPPDSRIAIFGLSERLLLLQGFTSDPEILKQALKADKKGQLSRLLDDPANGVQTATGAEANPDQYGNDPNTAQVLANLAAVEAQVAAMQQAVRTQTTLDALNLLARYLSGMSGRKNILWFSGSFPTNIALGDSDITPIAALPDLADEIRRTTNLLATSQSALYPIDSQGLFTSPSFSATVSRSSRGPAQSQNLANEFQHTATGHASMQALADDTGGQAFFNTNGLKEAALAAIEAGSNYYTLAYTPADRTADGSFRKLDVKVAGKSYRVTFRRGYFADPPEAPSSSGAVGGAPKPGTLDAAMMRGAPSPTEILFKVRAQPGKSDEATIVSGNDADPKLKGPFRRYTIDFSADMHNVAAQLLPDSRRHMSVEFLVLLYDQDNAMVNSVDSTFTGDVAATNYAQILRSGMKVRQQISVPRKGTYTLRVGVHDTLGNHMGSVEIPVSQLTELPDVPPPAATPSLSVVPATGKK